MEDLLFLAGGLGGHCVLSLVNKLILLRLLAGLGRLEDDVVVVQVQDRIFGFGDVFMDDGLTHLRVVLEGRVAVKTITVDDYAIDI